MRTTPLTFAAKGIGGVAIYVVVCYAAAKALVFTMVHWAFRAHASVGTQLELGLLRPPIFILCLFWGSLYASSFARPASFGSMPRIFRHLAASFVFGIVGCGLLIHTEFFPLPNFESLNALGAYTGLMISLTISCFVLALAAWIRMAFW